MNREAEFYLYTLHDPTLSSKGSTSPNVSFATLCPLVDRHTRWQQSCLCCTQSPFRQVQDLPLHHVLVEDLPGEGEVLLGAGPDTSLQQDLPEDTLLSPAPLDTGLELAIAKFKVAVQCLPFNECTFLF